MFKQTVFVLFGLLLLSMSIGMLSSCGKGVDYGEKSFKLDGAGK